MDSILKKVTERTNQKSFRTSDGYQLSYLEFFNPSCTQGPILVFPGMGEPAIKYWEVAEELVAKGFNVFILDHLGHGFSDFPRDQSQLNRIHIHSFGQYIDHANQWRTFLTEEHGLQDLYFLGNSMGGLIAHQLSGLYAPKKLAMVCPMFGIHTKGVPLPVAKFLGKTLPRKALAPLQKEYNQPNLKKNQVTQSQTRAQRYWDLLTQYPQLKRKGVTNGWVKTSLEANERVLNSPGLKLSIPTLLVQAGKDVFVRSSLNKNLAEKCAWEYVFFKDAKHEVLMEKDDYRSAAIKRIIDFFHSD